MFKGSPYMFYYIKKIVILQFAVIWRRDSLEGQRHIDDLDQLMPSDYCLGPTIVRYAGGHQGYTQWGTKDHICASIRT